MKAKKLYKSLDKEFELDKLKEDEWSFFDLGEYATENFMKTYKGLVLDNSKEIQKVYTAVFPSERVIDHILKTEEEEILLFTHHPMNWSPTNEGYPFTNIPSHLLEKLKARAISYYAIHVPLDRNGPYSTTASLARAHGVDTEKEFFDYFGSLVGIMGRTECKSVSELSEKVKASVGHRVKIWNYGDSEIADQRVALVAGGGNDPDIVMEIVEAGINTYITGISRKSPNWQPSLKFHEACEEHRINVIAATHYSTEKFACIAVLKFFETLGVPSEFVEGEPNFADYE
ncbi:MAG: Nif3-like dinuclear metal center hexameric protein [Candidatus Thorarchaeota archaeon]